MTRAGTGRAGWLAALAGLLACASPLAEGEARYREGDRVAALELWRSVASDSDDYDLAQRRIAQVEAEFEQLVVRYKQRARYFERAGRLAESVLNYRLALKLQPDDEETLAHVQRLARTLAAREAEIEASLRAALAERDIGAASRHLAALRELDPFDPGLESEERRVEESLRAEVDRILEEGQRQLASGNLSGATQAFESVLVLEPGNESAQGFLSYLATVRQEEDRSGRAGKPLRPPSSFASEAEIRAEGLHQNALVAEQAGDPWAAIRYDLRALDEHPGHDAAKRHLAALRAELTPRIDGLIESGRDHFRREDLQSALDQWRRVLLIDPTNEDALAYVARANRMLENLERLSADPKSQAGGR